MGFEIISLFDGYYLMTVQKILRFFFAILVYLDFGYIWIPQLLLSFCFLPETHMRKFSDKPRARKGSSRPYSCSVGFVQTFRVDGSTAVDREYIKEPYFHTISILSNPT